MIRRVCSCASILSCVSPSREQESQRADPGGMPRGRRGVQRFDLHQRPGPALPGRRASCVRPPWPVSLLLPRRPLVGWLLAAIGAAGYIVFAAGPVLTVAIAFAVGVIGIALALGRRASAAVPGTPPSRT